MIKVHLQPTDLQNIAFSFSPLLEAVSSYCLIRKSGYPVYDHRWHEAVLRATYGMNLPFMHAVVLAPRYMADFVTPTPTRANLSFEEELEHLRATPHDVVRKNVRVLLAQWTENDKLDSDTHEILRYFLAYPSEALDCLADELRQFWAQAIAPYWERVRSILENDILYQGRRMALEGVSSMVEQLDTRLRLDGGILLIEKPQHGRDEYHLEGRGLQLVPTLFTGNKLSWQIEPEWKPMVIYSARGGSLLHMPSQPDPESALVHALGESRARVLQALREPLHTAELAQQLQVTSGAVSQHLSRLSEAGLVTNHRSSSKVVYRLTPRGEKLLALFTE